MDSQIACKPLLIWQEGIKVELVVTLSCLYIVIEVCYPIAIALTLQIFYERSNLLFDILQLKEIEIIVVLLISKLFQQGQLLSHLVNRGNLQQSFCNLPYPLDCLLCVDRRIQQRKLHDY